MKTVRNALLVIFALPLAQIFWLARYANTKSTPAAVAGTVLTFVPIILFTTIIWGGAWMLLLNSVL
jgi:hypothetical protein